MVLANSGCGSDGISISDVHPEWEKMYLTSSLKTASQLQQGNLAPVGTPQHGLRESTQVFSGHWWELVQITICCLCFTEKSNPCLDSSLLLQGRRLFYWLFWYQGTSLPTFISLHLCNHSLCLTWVLFGPDYWMSLIWLLMI